MCVVKLNTFVIKGRSSSTGSQNSDIPLSYSNNQWSSFM